MKTIIKRLLWLPIIVIGILFWVIISIPVTIFWGIEGNDKLFVKLGDFAIKKLK